MRLIVLFGLLLAPLAPAHAAWYRASSEHFVVYADDSERDIRAFSDQLERFHAAMAFVTGLKSPPPSPSNRVTVYVVRNDREVRRLHGGGSQFVRGFYNPRAGGSIVVVPKVDAKAGDVNWSMLVLLHEYAHHFMVTGSRFPMPRWYSEGGAEFFGSASFPREGGVGIGRPAQHRAMELYFATEVTVEELLDPDKYQAPKPNKYDAYYGKSWLLFHYLTLGGERDRQIEKYLLAVTSGKSSREAALSAFGDLEDELGRYLRKRKFVFFNLPPDLVRIGEVSVERLTDGNAAMMPVIVTSRSGVTSEQAKELVIEARSIASQYRQDPAVLAALAEAEFDAGNNELSIAAADAALALDPSLVKAYVQKGYALFELAKDAADKPSAYKRAIDPFLSLNRIENDHPLPLIFYYRSYVEQQRSPPELAVEGLERAAELAPFDLELRLTLALQQIGSGKQDLARVNLAPVAYNPHGGPLAERALEILEALDRSGSGPGAAAVTAPPAGSSAQH